jgi:hypothetical protein
MSQHTAILTELGPETFLELLAASPRQAREAYFARHAIKAVKPASIAKLVRPGEKAARRGRALWDALQAREDDEVAEEILRSWLMTRRPMLGAALDHMGIAHQDGLTDSEDVQAIAKLSAAKLQALVEVLCANAPRWEVEAYLKFMGATL